MLSNSNIHVHKMAHPPFFVFASAQYAVCGKFVRRLPRYVHVTAVSSATCMLRTTKQTCACFLVNDGFDESVASILQGMHAKC